MLSPIYRAYPIVFNVHTLYNNGMLDHSGGLSKCLFFHKPLAKYKFQMSIQYVVLIHPAYSNLKTIYVYKKLYCLILKYCHSIV